MVTPGSMEQLLIYAALFCFNVPIKTGDRWEFTGERIDPRTISFDLRIYQFDQAICYEPSGDEIAEIMEIIEDNVAFVLSDDFNEEEING